MQTNNLKRKNKNKKARQIGRGGSKAKTAGRGTKGQNARAGRKKRPELRDFIKKLPKLRGRGKNINTSIQKKPLIISLDIIEKLFKDAEIVSPMTLKEKGVKGFKSSNMVMVKILSGKSFSKKVKISGCQISEGAKKQVESAGGEIVIK
jgi:large subunit ribosomal protein L15